MAWTNRLKTQAAYTAPDGKTRIIFDYEDVKKSVTKNTVAFDFPDADGTYVQDNGHSGRRFPLKVFFWGTDYDLLANEFELALLQRGVGKLEHPIYGTIDVVPFGVISRADPLKTAANQAIFEVEFFETTGLVYPTSTDDPGSEIVELLEGSNIAQAAASAQNIQTATAVGRATVKNFYKALLSRTSTVLEAIAATEEKVLQRFNAVRDSIERGIDVLVADPLSLAFQTSILIQLPARALTSITARLSAYSNLAQSIFSSNVDSSNEFHTSDLYASTYLTGSVLSVVNNQFITQTDAIEAAVAILEQFDDLVVWRDNNFETLGEIDAGAPYQKLQEAVALTAGFLVQISFTLKQERRIILDRNRTIIDLSAELYGEVTPQQLDFLIQSNKLTGSEILELPRGREILYYV